MSNLTLDDLEDDQQQLIEKTDIQTLASYCQELQAHQEKIELPYEETKYSTPARSTHLALWRPRCRIINKKIELMNTNSEF